MQLTDDELMALIKRTDPRAVRIPPGVRAIVDELCKTFASSAAVAAIEYALRADEGLAFLECWLYGQFDIIRDEWPDAPDTIFPTLNELAVNQCTHAKVTHEHWQPNGGRNAKGN